MTLAQETTEAPFYVFNKAAWDEKYSPDDPNNFPPGAYLELSSRPPAGGQLSLFPDMEKEKSRDSLELLKSSVRHALQIDHEVQALKLERKAIWKHLEECAYSPEAIRAAKAVVRAKSDPMLDLEKTAELEVSNASRLAHLIQLLDLPEDGEGDDSPPVRERAHLTLVHSSDTPPVASSGPAWGVNASRPENAYPSIRDAVKSGLNKSEAIKACMVATGKTKLEVQAWWDELSAAGRLVRDGGVWMWVETVSDLPEEPELSGLEA